MNLQKIALGLDVSKRTVDACLLFPDGRKSTSKITNSKQGFSELLSWLHGIDRQQLHVCLEPTGIYSRPLALVLHDSGLRISQVNSFAVQHHGRSKNFRSKTDRIDAYLLADYCLKHDPPIWTPPAPSQLTLRHIQRRLANIDESIRQEENRLEATCESALVFDDIEDSLGRLYVRRKRLEAAANELVRSDQRLAPNFRILCSIIGIGEESAIRMLSLIKFEQFESGRQVASFAGLAPRKHESGTSIHLRPRISKVGSSELRAALYFPAMVAIQHNPQMRALAERLRARNKPPKIVICAVMRKLLVLATALIRKQQFYDPQFASSNA
jgi:transposase